MGRDRKLTHEDRVLWSAVARTARPLEGRVLPENWLEDEWIAGSGKPVMKNRPEKAKTAAPKPPPATSRSSAHNPIERPVMRKIAKGRLPLEASIDLHGLMQAEAHDLLHGFLVRAYARGLRHVLVITGKGTTRGSEGVLKRGVPQWLAKPEFRRLVSGYEQAARGHGGEGALYIRLKRRHGDDT